MAMAEAQARAAAEREHQRREMQEREMAERQARASQQEERQARAKAERRASAGHAAEETGTASPRGTTTPDEPAGAIAAAEDRDEIPATGTFPPETDEVDALLARLRVGNVAFNAPQAINIKDTVKVRALVSPDESVETMKAQVDAPGEQVVMPVKVSKLMEARLTGEGFKIVPISQGRQAVGSGITMWEWEVTPLQEGRHRLTLSLDAFVRMDGQSVAKTLRTFDHPIDVEVTATQRIDGWVEQHGKWAWSTLLVPLWAWWNRRKKAKPAVEAA